MTTDLVHFCLVDFIDVTMAYEDANSKLVKFLSVANVDAENGVDNNLVQIKKLKFVHKTKLFRLSAQRQDKTLNLKL